MLAPLLSAAGPRITAAAFANDHLACGTLMQAASQGVAVPGRIALLGFGDFPIGRQLQPSLSTLRPPTAEIGQVAAQAVLESVGEGLDPASRALPCQLIARDSTGGAAAADSAAPH